MDTIFVLKITKGNNSAKNVGGVTVFSLCPSSDHALYFYRIFVLKITKGNNSAKNVGGVTVFNLCPSSGHALYFYQVL